MSRYFIKIVLIGMNAQVGKENTYKMTIGKHSLRDRRNDIGIRLINFAISKNRVISSTRFLREIFINKIWSSLGGSKI